MSFEILGKQPEVVYAPLNTTIDADRDYYSLTGLDACTCNGGAARASLQGLGIARDANGNAVYGPGPGGPLGDEGLPVLEGFYQNQQLTPGMYAPDELGAVDGAGKMLWVLGGLFAAWAVWAWMTPHESQDMGDW